MRNGVTRTDCWNIGRNLAEVLNINYAYGVEFLERQQEPEFITMAKRNN
jgi:hypothetical protein